MGNGTGYIEQELNFLLIKEILTKQYYYTYSVKLNFSPEPNNLHWFQIPASFYHNSFSKQFNASLDKDYTTSISTCRMELNWMPHIERK